MVKTNKLRLKKGIKLTKHNPFKTLLDKKFIAQTFWECLNNNDPDGAMEVISAHLYALNQVHFTQESEIHLDFRPLGGHFNLLRSYCKSNICI